MKTSLAFAAGFLAGAAVALHYIVEFSIVKRPALTIEEFDALWDAGVADLLDE